MLEVSWRPRFFFALRERPRLGTRHAQPSVLGYALDVHLTSGQVRTGCRVAAGHAQLRGPSHAGRERLLDVTVDV